MSTSVTRMTAKCCSCNCGVYLAIVEANVSYFKVKLTIKSADFCTKNSTT